MSGRRHDSSDWSDAERHVERAHECFEAGEFGEAEQALREAISLYPYRPDWHFNLGLTLEAAGRHDDAFRAFRDAHELDREDPQTVLAMGVNLLRCDDPRAAVQWLEKLQQIDPQSVHALAFRIEAYARLGEHEQAELMYYMAQQLDPTFAPAYAAMAESLLARGLSDRAVWCLREAAQLDPRMPHIHARLAAAYASSGRHERARQLYLKELRQHPGDVDTLIELGRLLIDMNRMQEAGEKFRRVLEMEPDNAHAHYYLAEVAERQGLMATAIEQLEVVLRLDADLVGPRRRLARMLLDRAEPAGERGGGSGGMVGVGDVARARELLAEEHAMCAPENGLPPQTEELESLGLVLLDAKMAREARETFLRVLHLRPATARDLHHLAVACFQAGDRARGMEASREALRLDPQMTAPMHNLAVACMHEGQWRRARYWVRQAMAVDPDDVSLRRLRMKLLLHALAGVAVESWRVVARRR